MRNEVVDDSSQIATLNRAAERPEWQLARLSKYWRVVVRWKWLISGIMISMLMLALLVTLLMTPLYTAEATIEISRQQDNVVNVKGVEPEVSVVDAEFYQTQYALLGARTLAERVVQELDLAANDEFFAMFGADPDHEGLFADSGTRRQTPEQRAARLRIAADILLEHITISPLRGSSLVTVGFESPNPQLSRNVVNSWTTSFIDMNLGRRIEASSYARTYLENRLNQLRARLEESERQVVRYAANARIVTIPGTGEGDRGDRSLVADDLARLNAELAAAKSDRVRAQSRLGEEGGTSSEALTNAALGSLRQRRAEVAAEYSSMLTRFEPDYPPAKALASEIDELDRSINQEVQRVGDSLQATYQAALERERTLQAQVDALTSETLDLRNRSIQYNIFQREADTNRQIYDALLQRYKEIGVAGGVGTNNILIVDAAMLPDEPSSPNLLLNLLVAFTLGAVVSTATVFAVEQIDETLNDPSDVERAVGLPQIGTSPALVDIDPREALADRKSPLNEAYLSIQTNLRFSTAQGVPKSFAITSTRPGEGKSTSAFALAQTLSRLGKKVVLIDADMRSPSVHNILGIENVKGVSNFLAGDDDLSDLIVHYPKAEIDAISAGPQPPNAAELLNGARLGTLVDRLLHTYDHVIVDSPPVLGLADAPLISNHVEGIVYAVEANAARASIIRTSIKRLLAANATIFGVILTKFEAKRAHYGYGYEYGYEYGRKD